MTSVLPTRDARRAWYVVAVLVTMMVLSYVDRAVLSLFAPLVQRDLSVSDEQLGVLFGVGFIAPLALATLVAGWAVDRYNRVLIIATGLLVWSTATALCGLAAGFGTLLLFRGLVGAGEAAAGPAGYAIIGDLFSPEHRGRAIGVFAAATHIGAGVALLAGGLLLDVLGPGARDVPGLGLLQNWQVGFLLLGAAGLPVILLLGTIRDPRPHRPHADSNLQEYSTAKVSSFLRTHWRPMVAIIGCGISNVTIGTTTILWAPTVMARSHNFIGPEVGYLLGALLVCGGLVGSTVGAAWSDRWLRRGAKNDRLRGHPLFFLILLVASAVFGFAPTVAVAAVGFFCNVLVVAAVNAISYAAIQDNSPRELRGRTLAILQFSTLLVSYSFGPSAVAFVSDHIFANPNSIGVALFAVNSALALIALALLWFGLYSRVVISDENYVRR